MDMDREYREARARQIRAAMKAAAPRMRQDFWRQKEQARIEGERRFGAESGR